MQFSSNSHSPYLNWNQECIAIYGGPGLYYKATNDNKVIDLNNGSVIESVNTALAKQTVTRNFSELAQIYIDGNSELAASIHSIASLPNQKMLDVPNLQWRKGCVPTAMAMIIGYHYGSLYSSYNNLIDALATNMSTGSNGYTAYNQVDPGTRLTLNSQDKYPASTGWATSVLGAPLMGETYNSFESFQTEIYNSRPVLVAVMNANGTSTEYGDGFGDHAMAGIGYATGTGNYIYVHTTQTLDGNWPIAVNSYNLGDYAWYFLDP